MSDADRSDCPELRPMSYDRSACPALKPVASLSSRCMLPNEPRPEDGDTGTVPFCSLGVDNAVVLGGQGVRRVIRHKIRSGVRHLENRIRNCRDRMELASTQSDNCCNAALIQKSPLEPKWLESIWLRAICNEFVIILIGPFSCRNPRSSILPCAPLLMSRACSLTTSGLFRELCSWHTLVANFTASVASYPSSSVSGNVTTMLGFFSAIVLMIRVLCSLLFACALPNVTNSVSACSPSTSASPSFGRCHIFSLVFRFNVFWCC